MSKTSLWTFVDFFNGKMRLSIAKFVIKNDFVFLRSELYLECLNHRELVFICHIFLSFLFFSSLSANFLMTQKECTLGNQVHKRYIVTFTDDFTHFTNVYLMERKSEVMQNFVTFSQMVSSHFGKQISRLRFDNRNEFKQLD